MQAELRKYRNDLATSGLGVIAFVIWTIAKAFIYTLLPSDTTTETFDVTAYSVNTIMTAAIIVIALVLIGIGLRIFVGLSARAHARGKKKSLLYVIVTILLMMYSLASVYIIVRNIGSDSVIDTVSNLVFEISSFLIMLRLVISSFKVRSIEKKLKAGAEHAD